MSRLDHLAPPSTVPAGEFQLTWEHNDWTGVERLIPWRIRLVAGTFPTTAGEGIALCNEAASKILGIINDLAVPGVYPPANNALVQGGLIVYHSTIAARWPFHDYGTGNVFRGTTLLIPGRGEAIDDEHDSGKVLTVIQTRFAFGVPEGPTLHSPGDIPEIDDFISWLAGHSRLWADKYGQKARFMGKYRLMVHPHVSRSHIVL